MGLILAKLRSKLLELIYTATSYLLIYVHVCHLLSAHLGTCVPLYTHWNGIYELINLRSSLVKRGGKISFSPGPPLFILTR